MKPGRCTHMKRLLSHHQHSVLCVLPHILVHVEGGHWHVDATSQKLHLNQTNKVSITLFMTTIYSHYVLLSQCGNETIKLLSNFNYGSFM